MAGRSLRWLRLAAWGAGALLGAFQFVSTRHEVNPDGISYLDLAEQYAAGEPGRAVSVYWSPLYPWLQGLAMRVFGSSPYWEATTAHLVNVAILIAIFAAFEFFMRSLLDGAPGERNRLPAGTTMRALGYSLLLWATFRLFTLGLVTPDGCVAVAVIVAAGLLCRVYFRGATTGRAAAFGFTLGVGYLAKAVMFPLAPFFLASFVLAAGSLKRGLRGALIAVAVFAVVVTPQVIAISSKHGSLTFGESKVWTYAVMVNRMTATDFWAGAAPDAGRPLAPPALLHDDPVVHGYGVTPGATYPFWYDAPRWLAGLDPPVRLVNQLRTLIAHARLYAELTVALWLPILALCLVARIGRAEATALLRSHGWLIGPSIVAVSLYALVHVEGRYVFSFFLVGGFAAFDGIRRQASGLSENAYRGIAWATSVALLVLTLLPGAATVTAAGRQVRRPAAAAHPHWAAAKALDSLGVRPGDPVGYIGDSYYAYWARLAGVPIVAELRDDPSEIWADPTERIAVLQAFERGGAGHVIAERVPPWLRDPRWERLGQTEFHIYRATP